METSGQVGFQCGEEGSLMEMAKETTKICVLPSPEIELLNSTLYSRDARKRSYSENQKIHFPRSTVLSSEEGHFEKKDDSGCFKYKQIYSVPEIQNDINTTGSSSRPEGQFCDFYRSQRCILAHPRYEVLSEIPFIRGRWFKIRVSEPTIWSKCSSQNFYKISECPYQIYSGSRDSDFCLSGRLVNCSSDFGHLPDSHKQDTRDCPTIWFSNKSREIMPDSHSKSQVARLDVGHKLRSSVHSCRSSIRDSKVVQKIHQSKVLFQEASSESFRLPQFCKSNRSFRKDLSEVNVWFPERVRSEVALSKSFDRVKDMAPCHFGVEGSTYPIMVKSTDGFMHHSQESNQRSRRVTALSVLQPKCCQMRRLSANSNTEFSHSSCTEQYCEVSRNCQERLRFNESSFVPTITFRELSNLSVSHSRESSDACVTDGRSNASISLRSRISFPSSDATVTGDAPVTSDATVTPYPTITFVSSVKNNATVTSDASLLPARDDASVTQRSSNVCVTFSGDECNSKAGRLRSRAFNCVTKSLSNASVTGSAIGSSLGYTCITRRPFQGSKVKDDSSIFKNTTEPSASRLRFRDGGRRSRVGVVDKYRDRSVIIRRPFNLQRVNYLWERLCRSRTQELLEKQKCVSSHSSIFKKGSSVLVKGTFVKDKSGIYEASSDSSCYDGRFKTRMGFPHIRKFSSIRNVDASDVEIPHQHSRVYGGFSSSKMDQSSTKHPYYGEDRQYSCSSLSQQRRFYEVSTSKSVDKEGALFDKEKEMVSFSVSHKRSDEHLGGQPLKVESPVNRMVIRSEVIRDNCKKIRPSVSSSRFIQHAIQPQMQSVRDSSSSRRSVCLGRVSSGLEPMGLDLSLSSSKIVSKDFTEAEVLQRQLDSDRSSVVEQDLVSVSVESSQEEFFNFRVPSFSGSSRESDLRAKILDLQTSRLDFIKLAMKDKFSSRVQTYVTSALRDSSYHQYQSVWEKFQHYCIIKDPSSINLDLVLNFLIWCFEEFKLCSNTIVCYKSALIEPLQFAFDLDMDHKNFGKIFRSMFLKKPSISPLEPKWDLFKVLNLLKSQDFNVNISAENLTMKTIFLLALALGRRCNELQSLLRDEKYIKFGPANKYVRINPNPVFLAKNELPSFRRKPILVKALPKSSRNIPNPLCPVHWLWVYLQKTDYFRGEKVFFNPNTLSVCNAGRISYYLRKLISISQPGVYARGHDLRKMACWLAFWSGMSLKYIREKGFWKTNSAILKCYLPGSVPLHYPADTELHLSGQ